MSPLGATAIPRSRSALLPTLRSTTRLSATTSARKPGGKLIAPSSGSGDGSGGGATPAASAAPSTSVKTIVLAMPALKYIAGVSDLARAPPSSLVRGPSYSGTMDDRELVNAFERGIVAEGGFHHAQHVRVAWYYLRHRPLLNALGTFQMRLRAFAAA